MNFYDAVYDFGSEICCGTWGKIVRFWLVVLVKIGCELKPMNLSFKKMASIHVSLGLCFIVTDLG
jgi:hypothetical protein